MFKYAHKTVQSLRNYTFPDIVYGKKGKFTVYLNGDTDLTPYKDGDPQDVSCFSFAIFLYN